MDTMNALFYGGRNELVCVYQKPLTPNEKFLITGNNPKAKWVTFEAYSLSDFVRKDMRGSYLSYLEREARKAARA